MKTFQGPMWSYEIVFEQDKRSGRKVLRTEVSETVVSRSGEQVIEYVKGRLKIQPNQRLIAIVRRHPIVSILNDDVWAGMG